jgi:hypothetical protein
MKGPSISIRFESVSFRTIDNAPSLVRTNILDITLQLIGVRTAVKEDLFNTGIGKKFECILDQRRVREGQKALDRIRVRSLIATSIAFQPKYTPEAYLE